MSPCGANTESVRRPLERAAARYHTVRVQVHTHGGLTTPTVCVFGAGGVQVDSVDDTLGSLLPKGWFFTDLQPLVDCAMWAPMVCATDMGYLKKAVTAVRQAAAVGEVALLGPREWLAERSEWAQNSASLYQAVTLLRTMLAPIASGRSDRIQRVTPQVHVYAPAWATDSANPASVATPPSQTQVFTQGRKRGKGKNRQHKGKQQQADRKLCFNCGSPNHLKADCTQKGASGKPSEGGKK